MCIANMFTFIFFSVTSRSESPVVVYPCAVWLNGYVILCSLGGVHVKNLSACRGAGNETEKKKISEGLVSG